MKAAPIRAFWTRLCLALPLLLLAPAAALGQAGAEAMQPALLEVRVNGQEMAEPAMLLRDPDGGLWASAATLAEWRIRLPPGEPRRHDGALWYRIDRVPGLAVTLRGETQMLEVDALPTLFQSTRTALAAREATPMTPPATGAFFGYDLFAEIVRGQASVSGAFEAGLFTPAGVGVSGFVGRAGAGEDRLVRLETSWTVDRPASMTSFRIGDSIAQGGPGARPVRFGGIQFARNFAVQPGFVTMPLPALGASAALPSVVEVYVNEALQGSRAVAPGPFELTQIPVQTGGGTVRLVVRDVLGRETVNAYSYYSSPLLLRRGLHDFSYEVGFVREGFGTRSNDYGAPIASTTHRYGLTDRLTLEAHAQATDRVRLAGAGAAWSMFDLGLLAGSVAVSHSDRGVGGYASASFERRGRGLSFGVRSELHGADFAFAGMAEDFRPPRLSIHAFADAPLLGGTVGANFVHRDHRDRPDETLAGVFGSFRIGRRFSLHLYVRRAIGGETATVAGAHLALALGGRRSAAASAEIDDGAASARISYQDDPPAGIGSGWRAAASLGEVDSAEAGFVRNTRHATFGVQAAHVEGDTGLRLSAAGAFGLIGGRAFAARALGTSFAAIEVPGQKGVRVYADNQLVGRTDAEGLLIVPSLRAFDRNLIRIEEADLPLDMLPGATEIAVRPFGRSGALVRFDAHAERGVLMEVRLENGAPLPAGARVRAEGGGEAFPVATGGAVYVAGLGDGAARLEAEWSGGRCAFRLEVPADAGPQPHVKGLVCRSEGHAAR